MRKLAYECTMPAATFNDSGTCLGQVRQLLAGLRAQLRAEGVLKGQVTVSILVMCDGVPVIESTQSQAVN